MQLVCSNYSKYDYNNNYYNYHYYNNNYNYNYYNYFEGLQRNLLDS